MFSVKKNECVGFKSRWKVKKVSLVNSTQTTEFSMKEAETNTLEHKSIEIQTDQSPDKPKTVQDDTEKLNEWLNKIYPFVIDELKKPQTAFNNYHLLDDYEDANIEIKQTINVFNEQHTYPIRKISSISWNSNGKILAISSTYSHKNWCHHEGSVFCYNLNKDNKISETPSHKLDSENCVMILKFHPNLPSVIAGGTFSGQIIIWNIEQSNESTVVIKIKAHTDGITNLSWINDIDVLKTIILASSSLDSFLKLWNFNLIAATLKLKLIYKIKPPLLAKYYKSPTGSNSNAQRAIMTFDFSQCVPELFMVGLEGGLIVQCSMLGITKLKGSTPQEPLYDPVFKFYEPHKDEIISLTFSPNRRDMFMTNGSDGEIRIYLIDQDEPAKVIFSKHPLSCVLWVPYYDKVIIGCGNNNDKLEIIHLIDKKPNVQIKGQIQPGGLYQMDISKTRLNTVAVGTKSGYLQLWDVPWKIYSI